MSIILTTFVPGTKAKADEINANFSTLKDALNEKAAIDGDNTQTFAVSDATENSHAVNKSQLDDLSDDLTTEIKKTGIKFCVRSGYTTDGEADLFSTDDAELTAKIGGIYDDLVMVDYEGTATTISSAPETLDLTGNADGKYNVFITTAGEIYILDNTIYQQADRPTMVVGDVWLNTGCEPFECIKYNGSDDVEFLDVPLGKVTFASNSITAVETFPFNQNGYNVTSQTELDSGTKLAASIPTFIMPDYENGVSKSWATTHQAPSNGFLYIWGTFGTKLQVSKNASTWITVQNSWFSSNGYYASSFIPISKGMYYKGTYTSSSGSVILIFYPCLAV